MNRRPMCGKTQRDGASDAAARPGNYGDFSIETK